MKLLYLLMALSLASATGFLAIGLPEYALIAGLGAVLLIIAQWKHNEDMAAGGFVLMVVASGLDVWKGGPALLALSSVCASLAAWDLASYVLLLHSIGVPPDPRLVRRRMLRLSIVLISGWGLGALASGLELSLRFGWLLLLALFVVLSLSISMIYLRQRDERSYPQMNKSSSKKNP